MTMTLRLCVMIFIASCPHLAQAEQHKLAASSVSSTYHAAGVALEAVTSIYLMPETGIKLTSTSTNGVLENIELLAKGQVDFAIIPSLLGFQARTGTGSAAALGPHKELRAVAMLVPTYYHALLRRSAIGSGSLDDLFKLGDQKLQIGLGASEAAGVTRFLFQKLGADVGSFDDLLSEGPDATQAFLDGEIDGLVTTGNLPIDEVARLLEEAGDDIAILGITDNQLRRADEGFGLLEPATVPAGTYPDQTEATETLALPVFLATRADVDEEVIYQIAKIMFEQIGFLRTIHPAMEALDFETAIDNLPVPLHPGAARYYQDFGLSIAETTTTAPEYPVYTLDADNPEQRRIETNTGVVGIMVDPDTTSLQTASELAVVVNSTAGDVRVVVQRGEGSAKTVNDLLYLKGVDLGIVQADVLAHLRDEEGADWLPNQLHYLARLYDCEVHILVRDDIQKLQDLVGKTVNFGPAGSASEVTAANIFAHLGLAVERKSDPFELAVEKLKEGEIDAIVISGGKPMTSLASIERSAGLKLLDIPLMDYRDLYQEASISSSDYPNLIDQGHEVRTLSVPAILITYKWPRNSERSRLLSSFYSTLEEQLAELQVKNRFHPKWQNVSLDASFEGWPRSSIAADVIGNDVIRNPTDDDVERAPTTLPTPRALPLLDLRGVDDQARQSIPTDGPS